eukprot:scaffold128136_cov61-Phaeocystis_antarctica.AAC.1
MRASTASIFSRCFAASSAPSPPARGAQSAVTRFFFRAPLTTALAGRSCCGSWLSRSTVGVKPRVSAGDAFVLENVEIRRSVMVEALALASAERGELGERGAVPSNIGGGALPADDTNGLRDNYGP